MFILYSAFLLNQGRFTKIEKYNKVGGNKWK